MKRKSVIDLATVAANKRDKEMVDRSKDFPYEKIDLVCEFEYGWIKGYRAAMRKKLRASASGKAF